MQFKKKKTDLAGLTDQYSPGNLMTPASAHRSLSKQALWRFYFLLK